MEPEHGALAALDLLGLVRVDHEREQRAVDARRGLDDVGDIRLATLWSKYSSFSPENFECWVRS